MLSYAGWLCLLNLVIESSFVHSFMVYLWPIGLISRMQKVMRKFFWSGSIHGSSGIRVAWKNCHLPKSIGGLGLKNFKL